MVLPWRRGGRVGHRRDLFKRPSQQGGAFYFGFWISDCGMCCLDLTYIENLQSKILNLVTPAAEFGN
jgi:hypothetical protein